MPLRKCLAIAQLWHQHPAMCGTVLTKSDRLDRSAALKIMISFTLAPQCKLQGMMAASRLSGLSERTRRIPADDRSPMHHHWREQCSASV
jgi:hypothetical protein